MVWGAERTLCYERMPSLSDCIQDTLTQRHQHLDTMLQITGANVDRSLAPAIVALSFWNEDYARASKGSETPALALGRFSPQQTQALLATAAYLQRAQHDTGAVSDAAFQCARRELSQSTLALVGDVLDAYRVVNYRAEHRIG